MSKPIKYKSELFSVPVEPLDDAQLEYWAWRVAREAQSVYGDDPGVYPNFQMYLGFRIGVESIQYVTGGRAEMERFAQAVMKHAFS